MFDGWYSDETHHLTTYHSAKKVHILGLHDEVIEWLGNQQFYGQVSDKATDVFEKPPINTHGLPINLNVEDAINLAAWKMLHSGYLYCSDERDVLLLRMIWG